MRADPDGADQDAAARRSERDVWLSKTIAGMWAGGIRLDPVSGAVVACELDRLETELFEADWAEAQARLGRKPIPAELVRTSAQRRADALVEMAKRSAAMPPDAKQARVLISFLAGEGTFRNLCEVEITRQPIPPGAVREWLDDALFERILFDGPDRVLSVSHRREFPDAVRRAIQVRDRTCNAPTCDVPGLKCQIDHVDPHGAGGPTAIGNGQCLCKHDNARKGTTPGPAPTRRS